MRDPRMRWAEAMERFVAEIQETQRTLLEVQDKLIRQAQEVPGGTTDWTDEEYCKTEKKLREATEHYREARKQFVNAECDWAKGEMEDNEDEEE